MLFFYLQHAPFFIPVFSSSGNPSTHPLPAPQSPSRAPLHIAAAVVSTGTDAAKSLSRRRHALLHDQKRDHVQCVFLLAELDLVYLALNFVHHPLTTLLLLFTCLLPFVVRFTSVASRTRPLDKLHIELRLRCTLHPQKALHSNSEECALELDLRHALSIPGKSKPAVVLEEREDVV
ncbi:hypothetical protein CVT25_008847 [Psilocybe cyanescens]|uniref:Uncharacterized protein n=1 Tax=Psilocybe cyanescens TaxID=93625 RepID=A0A409XAL0_PSICY|nr:hypothetical protein CVT25_008847 [Psilocybe cyanescens]